MLHLNMHIIILFAFRSRERHISSEKENFKGKKHVQGGPDYFRILLFLRTLLVGFHLSQLLCACSVCKARFLAFPNFQLFSHISELILAQFALSLVSALQRDFYVNQLGHSARKGLEQNGNQNPQELPQPYCTFHCKSIHSVNLCTDSQH